MTTRQAACSCGQLYLTIEDEPSHISMCSCLGALPPRTGHLRRKGYDVGADSRKRPRADLSFLSDVRLHRLLGEHRLSWNRHGCHRQLRRPEFPPPIIAVWEESRHPWVSLSPDTPPKRVAKQG